MYSLPALVSRSLPCLSLALPQLWVQLPRSHLCLKPTASASKKCLDYNTGCRRTVVSLVEQKSRQNRTCWRSRVTHDITCPHKSRPTPAVTPSMCHAELLSAVKQWTIMWCSHSLPACMQRVRTWHMASERGHCSVSGCLYSGWLHHISHAHQIHKSTHLEVWKHCQISTT